MVEPQIRAYANCDDALVVWRYDEPIAESRGFALVRRFVDERRSSDEQVETVRTFAPFAGQQADDGESRPSSEWPIQRFVWTDVLVRAGFTHVSYRAVPLLRDGDAPDAPLREDEGRATGWSDPIDITPRASDELSAYFNRGVVATQALAHRLSGRQPWKHRLSTMIATPGDDTRHYLGGPLRDGLFELLDRVRLDDDVSIYAALFELNDPELLGYLRGIGARAHVVLANGAGEGGDENAPARITLLDADVDVRNRLVLSGLAHNKFLVVCDRDEQPSRVWTGSTNWTMTGLCTQVNNALLIENAEVAGQFLEQWQRLAAAGNTYPATLKQENARRKDAQLAGGGSVGTWFTPIRSDPDLANARELIARARDGILFLMFNPGQRDTLFHAIMARTHPDDPTFDADLYIHGVMNQDPNAGGGESEFKLIQHNEAHSVDPSLVLPAAIDRRFGHWERELSGLSPVMVHSKLIVIDPFGELPVVMTGSHNLGTAASEKNDDNLAIVTGVPRLAAAYATNVKAVYDAYRWRYLRSRDARDAGRDWNGPVDDASWQDGWFRGDDGRARQRELRFWLGAGA